MKKRIVSTAQIAAFKALLVSEEKSAATTEKYIRDVKAFAEYMQNNEITKESVLAYKKHIQQNYAVRSVNSMIASINGFFSFLCWYDLKVKALKIQRQVFCTEEKELTKPEYLRLCRAADEKRKTETYPANYLRNGNPRQRTAVYHGRSGKKRRSGRKLQIKNTRYIYRKRTPKKTAPLCRRAEYKNRYDIYNKSGQTDKPHKHLA